MNPHQEKAQKHLRMIGLYFKRFLREIEKVAIDDTIAYHAIFFYY